MIRAHLIVHGKVQGVNFRYYFSKLAQQMDICGWIQNGNSWEEVEAVVEGDETKVRDLINWCWKGPPRAEIKGVKTIMEKYRGEFTKFEIKR